jgi:transposase-like protein
MEDGHVLWLWIVYEPNLNRCLMIYLSIERTVLVYYGFFIHMRNRYDRKPIFTDGVRWYSDA